MLSGDPTLRAFDNQTRTYGGVAPLASRVSFHCLDSAEPDIPEQPFMFRTACDDGLRAQILFPSCWDGENLYLPDSAHVAYQRQIGNGGCPPSHPVLLPLLFFEVLYFTNDVVQSPGGEFVFAQGDPTGYGFHGDFMNGWAQDVLDAAVNGCLSLAGDVDGTIDACPALASFHNVNFARTCPQQPPVIAEPVTGELEALPGCNPVEPGPEPAPLLDCACD